MNQKIQHLIHIARERMRESNDPVHDLAHVERVVEYTKKILSSYDFDKKQEQALVLAAWWHDIGRTINRNCSFVLMSFVDDFISAIILWFFTLKHGLFGKVVGISTRVILCKNIGADALFTKIFLTRESRILLDIIKDADNLDVISVNRAQKAFHLTKQSRLYKWGYKAVVWWFINYQKFSFKTQKAKQMFKDMLVQFVNWLESEKVYLKHTLLFGEKFVDRSRIKLKKIYHQL